MEAVVIHMGFFCEVGGKKTYLKYNSFKVLFTNNKIET